MRPRVLDRYVATVHGQLVEVTRLAPRRVDAERPFQPRAFGFRPVQLNRYRAWLHGQLVDVRVYDAPRPLCEVNVRPCAHRQLPPEVPGFYGGQFALRSGNARR